jgi:hypothetical protein
VLPREGELPIEIFSGSFSSGKREKHWNTNDWERGMSCNLTGEGTVGAEDFFSHGLLFLLGRTGAAAGGGGGGGFLTAPKHLEFHVHRGKEVAIFPAVVAMCGLDVEKG